MLPELGATQNSFSLEPPGFAVSKLVSQVTNFGIKNDWLSI